jgi:MFS family permease
MVPLTMAEKAAEAAAPAASDYLNSPDEVPSDVVTRDIEADRPFSAFSIWQKRWIVVVAAFAAWFSAVSSFIFFPAITALARGIGTGIQEINLTVTSYFLVAAIAPALTATVSDTLGRRPALLGSFLLYVMANVGLALQTSFAALFVLRMVQASGVAGTYAIAYGIVSDLATPAERGTFAGIVALW